MSGQGHGRISLLMPLLQAFIFTESLPLECEGLLAKRCLFSTFHVLTPFLTYHHRGP